MRTFSARGGGVFVDTLKFDVNITNEAVVLGERFLKPWVAIGLKAIVAHSIVQTKIVKQKGTVAMSDRLDGIKSQALEVVASLVKFMGLWNLGNIPSRILQDLVEQPNQLIRLRTMCFWDSVVAPLTLQTFDHSKKANLSARLSNSKVVIDSDFALDVIGKSPQLVKPKNVILCACSVFQLTGQEFGATMDQIINSLNEVRVNRLRGCVAPVELLWEIANSPKLLPAYRPVLLVMQPVEYNQDKFALLELCRRDRTYISLKQYYQTNIPGDKMVMFILENDE